MDIEAIDHGSIIALVAHTDAGREWIAENVNSEEWQWMGGALCIDHRYAGDILYGAQEDGLALNVGVVPA